MTAEAIHIDEKAKNFIINLKKAIETAQLSRRLFASYPILAKILFNCNTTMKSFREAISHCDRSCKDPTQCAEHFCKTAMDIRDDMLTLLNLSNLTIVLYLFRRPLKKAAIAWDDFVEDCFVASDSEINNLLDQIAHVA